MPSPMVRAAALALCATAAPPAQDARLAKLLATARAATAERAVSARHAAEALAALAELGPAAAPVAAELGRLVDECHPLARAPLLRALGDVGPYAEPPVPGQLIDVLRASPWIRRVLFRPRSDPASSRELSRTEIRLRMTAGATLEDLEAAVLRSENHHRRAFAAELLRRRGAEELLPVLERALRGPLARRGRGQVEASCEVARAIIAISGADARAIPGFAWLCEHAPPAEALDAFGALRRFGADAAPATGALARIAAGPADDARRREAIVGLGVIGPGAGAAIETLERIRTDGPRSLRGAAAAALAQIRGR